MLFNRELLNALHTTNPLIFLKRFYLFIFRERGREGESKGEKHQCMVASHTSPTRDLACNPGMCPDWKLNQRLFGLQTIAQSIELHQSGLNPLILKKKQHSKKKTLLL